MNKVRQTIQEVEAFERNSKEKEEQIKSQLRSVLGGDRTEDEQIM